MFSVLEKISEFFSGALRKKNHVFNTVRFSVKRLAQSVSAVFNRRARLSEAMFCKQLAIQCISQLTIVTPFGPDVYTRDGYELIATEQTTSAIVPSV